jgi:hypothetical protein
MEIQLKGKVGVIGLIVVILALGIRITTLGESNETALRQAVGAELVLRLGGRISDDLASIGSVEAMDAEATQTLLERADSEGITVHSMIVSKPVLTFASSEDVVVQVEYSLPQGPRQKEYWLFQHSVIAGWRYRYQTTAWAYYTNLF